MTCDKCIWWLCVTKMLSISFHWHCFSLFFPSSLLICTSLINCYYPSCHVWTYLVHSVKIHVSSVIVLQVTHDELVWPDSPHSPNICRFIYILDSSNSSSFTFWSSQFASSSRSNWTAIWTGNSNGSWTDKHSSHFSTAKEIRVKATFFFM